MRPLPTALSILTAAAQLCSALPGTLLKSDRESPRPNMRMELSMLTRIASRVSTTHSTFQRLTLRRKVGKKWLQLCRIQAGQRDIRYGGMAKDLVQCDILWRMFKREGAQWKCYKGNGSSHLSKPTCSPITLFCLGCRCVFRLH
jgi:hypothetical protein